MLPTACDLEQHFQDLGHSFSLYGPPSRPITYISPKNIYLRYESAKTPDKKKRKEDEQTLADLSSAHCRLQEQCQLVQTSYIKQYEFLLFAI